jgi:hypothetical protein
VLGLGQLVFDELERVDAGGDGRVLAGAPVLDQERELQIE